MALEARVAEWARSRIGPEHMQPKERAMRLPEEAVELAQAEGITMGQAIRQATHVYMRPGWRAGTGGGQPWTRK